jgi:16S rRNA (guanine(966)-N(2))-methyltransferase RsmD
LIKPKNLNIRPTSDRAKETIFNTLDSILINKQLSYEGLIILDGFCGSGALGIEAISRGAKEVYFIDNDSDALNITRKNCKLIQSEKKSYFLKMDLENFKSSPISADIFFLDPPYNKYNIKKILDLILKNGLVKSKSYGVIELPKNNQLTHIKNFTTLQIKVVSNSSFLFLSKD